MSEINPAVIQDNSPVQKSALREQLTIAAEEITALQVTVTLPRRMANDDTTFDNL